MKHSDIYTMAEQLTGALIASGPALYDSMTFDQVQTLAALYVATKDLIDGAEQDSEFMYVPPNPHAWYSAIHSSITAGND